MSTLRRRAAGLVVLIGLLVGLVLAGPAGSVSAAPAPIPAPATCVDLPGVLGEDTCATITTRLAADERATTDELAVLVVRTTGDESIEDYALRVFNTWGVGKAGKDNGILLVVALDDRTVRIQVGTGLEKVMTDGRAREIIGAELVPLFRSGDYRQGILNGLDAIRARIGHDVTSANRLASIPEDPGYRPPTAGATASTTSKGQTTRTRTSYAFAYDSGRGDDESDSSSSTLTMLIVLLVLLVAVGWAISAARGPAADGDAGDSGGGSNSRRRSWSSRPRSFSGRSSSRSSSSGSRSRSSFGGGRSRGGGGSGSW